MNYQTLAPPITKENAGEYARRATISRERNRAARKAQFLACPDVCARKEIEKQIQKVLRWMEKVDDKKEYARLCVVLDRLWNKAYAEVRPTKRPMGRPPLPVAQNTWQQEPPAPEPTPAPETVEQIRSPSTPILITAPAAPQPPPLSAPVVPDTVSETASAKSPLTSEQPQDMGGNDPTKELRSMLNNLYRRAQVQPWPEGELTMLAEIARRPGVLQEFQVLVNYRRRIQPSERVQFPNSIRTLFAKWEELLARASGR